MTPVFPIIGLGTPTGGATGQAAGLNGHPWRVLIRRAKRKLIRRGVSPAFGYDGTEATDEDRRVTEEGERVWVSYGVGLVAGRPWWEASFADTRIIVSRFEDCAYDIPYANIAELRLGPNIKTEVPSQVILDGSTYLYTRSVIVGYDGREYEVLGAVAADGCIRDIFQWHSVVAGGHSDHERAARAGSPDRRQAG